MAQAPDTTEIFVREVDENLRRDQIRDFFKKYGSWLIAGVIVFLAASGGFIWWQQHRTEQFGAQVERLGEVYRDIGSGDAAKAPRQLDALAESDSKAVRASALFTRAALAIQQSDLKLATATYRRIAEDSSLPKPYREAALVRRTAIEFDQVQPQEVIERLRPLAKPGEPWFGTAGEMTALALIKQGKKQEAGRLFGTIAKDKTVPEPIRARCVQIAGSLGFDVSDAAGLQSL